MLDDQPSRKSFQQLIGTPTLGLRLLREILITIGLAAAVFFLVQGTVRNYRVEGYSMEPSLGDGELLLVNKLVYIHLRTDGPLKAVSFFDVDHNGFIQPFGQPKRGDVIVFHSTEEEGRFLVKRLIGLPGDTVEMKGGVVYSNGTPVDERGYVENPGTHSMAPARVPVGHYWVMGDNRTGSRDSRSWGTLPGENIVGKAWLAYWPKDRVGLIDAPRF